MKRFGQEPNRNLPRTSSAAANVPKSCNQTSERCLDDEALLRMDDEGGSNPPVEHSEAGE